VRIYLDHNATTPLDPEARAAILAALDGAPANPSSLHGEGRRARTVVEAARDQVAALLGGMREEIVFTASGTEADHVGLIGLARATRRRRIVASPVEHPAVDGALAALAAEGFVVERLAVAASGVVELPRALADDVGVVVLQAVNHETGVIQPVAEAARLAHAAGAVVFCDAVQAAGKLQIGELDADVVAVSSHKIYGPVGAGALRVRRSLDIGPLVGGGGQERGRRPGTEPTATLAGFGLAARLAHERLGEIAAIGALRDRFEGGLIALGAHVAGAGAPRIATVNARFDGVDGRLLAESLDLAGVAVSTGSACSSGSSKPSPVLLAMGLSPDEARRAVRFSLGRHTTAAEIDTVLALLPSLLARIRAA
jgi:cysteine desulfurase